ncbi:MAG: hypothetical protein IJ083_14610 [Clostridia bacterium]|nr:hypothetical protein [Clostridia bacterium]
MAYFSRHTDPEREHQQVFLHPVMSDSQSWDGDDGAASLEASMQELEEEEKRDRVRLLFSVGDLLGVIFCTLGILVLIALLIYLYNWVSADIYQSFTLLHGQL